MPRQLLRDGRIVADDWRYHSADAGHEPPADAATGLILKFERWLADKAVWLAMPGRLGVVLAPVHRVEQLAPDLARFDLVAAEFSGPGEGRGYSQGRLLRERYGFQGELRAVGYVRRDQVFFLARCGFNSFELPDGELAGAGEALGTFSAQYQPANDAGLAVKLRRRELTPAGNASPAPSGRPSGTPTLAPDSRR
jgi:uncharacterized protein (DUF934 family)